MVSFTSPIAQRQVGQTAMTAAFCVSIMTLANMCGRIGNYTSILYRMHRFSRLLLRRTVSSICANGTYDLRFQVLQP